MEKQLIDYITKEFIHEELDAPLDGESNLLTSGLIDSMGIMLLTSYIENEYSITIPPEDVRIENFMNVKSIVEYINSRH